MSHIRMEGLGKSYEGTPVLKGIQLTVNHRELITLLGPSGCGKSTLLRIISGLTEPDEGRLFIDDQPMEGVPPHARGVGMIFQQYSLFPAMTVFENVSFGLEQQKKSKEVIRTEVIRVLESVRMIAHKDKYPIQLSGGEQQRVALARSLVTSPGILLLDEPFSAIDAALRASLQQELLELHKAYDMTMIFVTHDQDEAMLLSDRIVLMDRGNIVQIGAPEELYLSPINRFAAEFIGKSNVFQWKKEGQPELFSLRPERIHLLPPGDDSKDCRLQIIPGNLLSVRQIGAVRHHLVQTELGVLRVQSLMGDSHAYAPGDEVQIQFSPDDLTVLEVEGAEVPPHL